MKERKNKNIKMYVCAIITILSFVLVTIGATVAVHYFVNGNEDALPITVKTAYVSINFEAKNEVKDDSILPGWSDELNFTVSNISKDANSVAKYRLIWDIEKNELTGEDFVYTIKCDSFFGDKQIEESDVNKTINISSPRKVPGVSDSLGEGIMDTGVRHECTLKIYFRENGLNQDEYQGKSFSGKVYIKGDNE